MALSARARQPLPDLDMFLLSTGYALGYTPAMRAAVAARGIDFCDSAQELAARVDVLFTSLPGPADVERVMVAGGVPVKILQRTFVD